VSAVTPGGAAEKAGIKRGDVIMSYQGRAVIDTNSFRNEIAATKPGTTIALGVLRDGTTSEVKATLSENADAKKAGPTPRAATARARRSTAWRSSRSPRGSRVSSSSIATPGAW
jgi:serine protease Do